MKMEYEFLVSWNESEYKYKDFKKIEWFIIELRKLGFDKTLRAGTSVHDLMLSRSKEHGLRLNQAYIHLGFHTIISSLDGLNHIGILKQKANLPEEELGSLLDAEKRLKSTTKELTIHFHGDTFAKTFTTPFMITEELLVALRALEKIPIS